MAPRLAQGSLAQQIELDHELKKLIKKRVIRPTHGSPTGHISPIFTTEKKDGSTRLILNLKQFNHYIQYKHFKMENLQDVLDLMKPGVWMASIDLCDAYYTIPVNSDHQKYLTFSWRGTLYCYTCMPNGYSQAPYIFTKILKVPFAYLRKNGHSSVVYIDDTYLQGDSPEDCERNIHNTAKLLWDLRFSIHPDKSVLMPTQKLEFLGFALDSKAFIIFLKQKILTMCQEALNSPCQKIKATASLVGCLIAALPGVTYGALFYRRIEHCKNNSLKLHKGNYKKKSMVTEDALEDVKWWATNVNAVTSFIYPTCYTHPLC